MLKHLKGDVFDVDDSVRRTGRVYLGGNRQTHFLKNGVLRFGRLRFTGQGLRIPVLLARKLFNRELPDRGDPVAIVL